MPMIRGPQTSHAIALQREMDAGVLKPFKDIFYGDIGDSQAMGQTPVTFIRQVTSLCMNPQLASAYPKDVQQRVAEILKNVHGQSIGAYSNESGIPLIRRHIAEYIADRDDVHCSPDDIFCSNGASGAIKDVLSMFRGFDSITRLPMAVLTPVPQYPLYGGVISELGLQQVPYYLNEENAWNLEVSELERVIREARKVSVPRVLVIINPGNPTGQVLSRQCIEEVIKFAYRENLFIFADEVYHQNVYKPEMAPFNSFKRVLVQMGHPYSHMELASFMSVSKGYAGECGVRGGYVELFNLSAEVKHLFNLVQQTHVCPSVIGQVVLDCVVKEPVLGDESYKLFTKEKAEILESLKRRAELASEGFNDCIGVSCNPVLGSMYAYPRLHLPIGAIEEARKLQLPPDEFYAIELLRNTGGRDFSIFILGEFS